MYPLRTRLKQKLYHPFVSHKVSIPFISQAFFRSICDVVIESHNSFKNLSLRKARNQRTIYCNSAVLRDFLSEFASDLQGVRLIAGGSDEIFIDEDLQLGKVSRLYLQNSHISDGKRVLTLPIGLEDLALALNGFPSLLKSRHTTARRQVLVGPFSSTHPIRNEILRSIQTNEEIVTVESPLSPKKYSRLVQEFPAIACPRGNGEDTHRLWETLYRGSIPVLVRNKWSMSLEAMGVPLILIDDWSEDALSSIVAQVPLKPLQPQQIPILWSNYWINEMNQ